MLREIITPQSDEYMIHIPKEYINTKVEILVLPFDYTNEEMIQKLAHENNFEIVFLEHVTNERFPKASWQKWLTVLLRLK